MKKQGTSSSQHEESPNHEFQLLLSEAKKLAEKFYNNYSFNREKGTIEIQGVRYLLLNGSAMSVDFYMLIRSLFRHHTDEEADGFTTQLLYNLALSIGRSEASFFKKRLNIKDPKLHVLLGPMQFAQNGWSSVQFIDAHLSKDDHHYSIYKHPHSFEADSWLKKGIYTKKPICAMNAGYATGWVSECLNLPLKSIEIQCRACKDDECMFVMAPPHKIHSVIQRLIRDYALSCPHYKRQEPYEKSIESTKILESEMISAQKILQYANKLESSEILLKKKLEDLEQEVLSRKLVEKQLAHLAKTDPLTKLPNRYAFNKYVVSKLAKKNAFHALAYIDLDDFKNINDFLGHQTGDDFLINVSQILKEIMQDSVFIARFGGDEFAIFFSHYESRRAIIKLLKKFTNKFIELNAPGSDLCFSLSIGVALFPSDANTLSELQRKADLAMYDAKNKGRNNISFYKPILDKELELALTIKSELLEAFKEKTIDVHYQPQIDINTGEVVGAEALLRWDHPMLGALAPTEVIPVAESYGMVNDLTVYVLGHVGDLIRDLIQKKLFFGKIAVNLSPLQFSNYNVLHLMKNFLVEREILPKYLEVEITESALIRNERLARKIIKSIKRLGIKLSIDDFGTGFSSLSYINKFPFDNLKLDITFISFIDKNDKLRKLTSSIIDMAHLQKILVIAEGVETAHQLTILQNTGCDYGQGNYISPPLPKEDFIRFLKKS